MDLADYAVKHAMKLGATYVEARWERASTIGVLLKNGVPQVSDFSLEEGVGVRILREGVCVNASTNILKKEEIRKMVEEAVRTASSSTRLSEEPTSFSVEKRVRKRYGVKEKKKVRDVEASDMLNILKDVDSVLADAEEVSSRHLFLGHSIIEKYYTNTEGSKIFSRIPSIGASVFFTLKDNNILQRQKEFSATGGYERLDAWNLPEWTLEEVKNLRKMLTKGRRPDKGPMDVVCAPEIVGIAVHESVGHPFEADRVMGREAAQGGESYLNPGDIGRRIGSIHVNVVDDPTIEGSAGYFLFDDEGVAAQRKVLLSGGVVSDMLHNRETARRIGRNSNGSARASDYSCEPLIRMSNTFLLPGDESEEELIESVRKGIYMKSFMEWNIDDRRVNQRYVSAEAYAIRNGRLVEPVRNVILEVSTEGLWSSLEGVADNLEFSSGICGKGEPLQGIGVWMGGPTAKFAGLRVR